jgi:hypothetical protein
MFFSLAATDPGAPLSDAPTRLTSVGPDPSVITPGAEAASVPGS